MSAPLPEASDWRGRARHHLRRRQPAVCAGRRRDAARPAGRAVRAARMGGSAAGRAPIRITGPGSASSAASCGSPRPKAAATWRSSDRSRGRRSGASGRIFEALRLMPQLVQLYRGGDDHLQSGLGRLFEQHGFRLLGAAGDRARTRHAARPARQPRRRASATAPTSRAALRCSSHRARSTSARPWWSPTIGCWRWRAAEGTDQMLARVAELRRNRPHPRRRRARACWSRPPSSARTIASICPSIGPSTIEARRRGGPCRHRRRRRLDASWPSPSRIAAAADRAGIFVVGVNADGTGR